MLTPCTKTSSSRVDALSSIPEDAVVDAFPPLSLFSPFVCVSYWKQQADWICPLSIHSQVGYVATSSLGERDFLPVPVSKLAGRALNRVELDSFPGTTPFVFTAFRSPSAAVPRINVELVYPIKVQREEGTFYLPGASPKTTLDGKVRKVPRSVLFERDIRGPREKKGGKSYYLVRLSTSDSLVARSIAISFDQPSTDYPT
jgi:hypothetical protein